MPSFGIMRLYQIFFLKKIPKRFQSCSLDIFEP